MAMAVVLHRVEDYEAFRANYEESDPLRKAAGVTAESVHRMSGDPDNVLVIHHFESVSAARDFFGSPILQEVMKQVGVLEPIRVEYFD